MREGAGRPAELLQQSRQALMVAVAGLVVVEMVKTWLDSESVLRELRIGFVNVGNEIKRCIGMTPDFCFKQLEVDCHQLRWVKTIGGAQFCTC